MQKYCTNTKGAIVKHVQAAVIHLFIYSRVTEYQVTILGCGTGRALELMPIHHRADIPHPSYIWCFLDY